MICLAQAAGCFLIFASIESLTGQASVLVPSMGSLAAFSEKVVAATCPRPSALKEKQSKEKQSNMSATKRGGISRNQGASIIEGFDSCVDRRARSHFCFYKVPNKFCDFFSPW
jgi:hypothetical protein